MNAPQPPPVPRQPSSKGGLPTWAIVLIVAGGVGVIGVAIVGMLAAIAIPNFVRARDTAIRNVCINNLRMIDSAKQQWARENQKNPDDTPTQSEIVAQLPNQYMPICPAGGSYSINSIAEKPTCSNPKHFLPEP